MKLGIIKAWVCALAAFMAIMLTCGVLLICAPRAYAAESGYELDMSGAPTETLCFAEVIGNDMLYQQNEPVSVWGFAPAGSEIEITLSEQSGGALIQRVQVQANSEGYYIAELNGMPASYTEYKIVATDGITTVTAERILFGELFLSAGQSNMALNVKYCSNADEILDNADNPYIRVFMSPEIPGAANVPYYPAAYWEGGVWARGDSSALIQGASAVCYNFALDLFDKLNTNGLEVPVGFLNAAKGATSIEAWLSRPSIDLENAEVYEYLDDKGRLLTEEEYNQKGSQNFNQVSAMFNSKIAPLSNLYIAGILWYQGENNVGNEVAGQYYRKALSLLAQDWSKWFNGGTETVPMIFAQITPHNYEYEGEAFAYMMEGMAEAYTDNAEHMVMVTTYDIPLDWYNPSFAYRSPIHPIVKEPVGKRMAAFAYNMLYGGTGAKSSPVLKEAKFADGKAILSFDNATGLKTTNGLDVTGFTLCGANRIFYPADAGINADGSVTLTSRWVKEPIAAAYAFSEMISSANLCSEEGFPVAPFRTDKVESVYYHPKDWQLCDATQYFVSYGSGTDESLAKYFDAYTTSTNTSLTTVTNGDSGNALQLNYTLRGREEFYISPVLGKDKENGIFEQFINYDTISFKVRNSQGRDVDVARVQITLADNRTFDAALAVGEGTGAKVPANGEEFTTYYFSLNPTFAQENATQEELAALRAMITDIKVYFRDFASGSIEVDSFDYGNIADLNLQYDEDDSSEGETNPPDQGETEDPDGNETHPTPGGDDTLPPEGSGEETGGDEGGCGGNIAHSAGIVGGILCLGVIALFAVRKKKE